MFRDGTSPNEMRAGGTGGGACRSRSEAARGPAVVRGKDQEDFRQPDANAQPASGQEQENFAFAFSYSESIAKRKIKEEAFDADAIAIPYAD